MLPFWKVSLHDKAHPSQSFSKCWGCPTGGRGQDAALTGGAQLWGPKMPFLRPHLGPGARQALGSAQSLPSPCSPSVKVKVQKSQTHGHLPCQEVREPSREGHKACNVPFQMSKEVIGLPQWLSSKESPAVQEIQIDPGVGKIPWRRAWQPTPEFLPGESHGQRSPVGYSVWGHKELEVTEVA